MTARTTSMLSSEAKHFVGRNIELTFIASNKQPMTLWAEVFDINFIALKGPCIITDQGDIRLDRVVSAKLLPTNKSA